jgi:hypothetical protein
MKYSPIYLAAACAVALGVPIAPTAAVAGDNVAKTTDPGFTPDIGQINRGFDEKVPTDSQAPPIPTPAQARAAKMMPDNSQPALEPQSGDANAAAATTGSASPTPAPVGPIGATGQTMPAKFSQRNDILDQVPIMAQPMTLSDQDRQQIYEAVMADKTPAASDAEALAPAGQLDGNQALNETHPLPSSVSGISGVQKLGYVKTKNKVFLVEPDTRIVVDEIGS